LNIKYNKHKQEIKDDPVLDWMLEAKEFIQKNANKLIVAVIAIVVLISGVSIFNSMQKSAQQKAQDAFGMAVLSYQANDMDKAIEGFKSVITNYGSSTSAVFSSYLLGTIYNEQGKFDDAINAFQKAIKSNKSADFVNGQALEAIAVSYEAKGDTESALKFLQKALEDKRISYRFAAIRYKMALLNSSKDESLAKKLCNEIISDTTAIDYHQKAENLLATFNAKSAG